MRVIKTSLARSPGFRFRCPIKTEEMMMNDDTAPVLTPENPSADAFDNAAEAVARLEQLYAQATSFWPSISPPPWWQASLLPASGPFTPKFA